ncbi:hypothetical protein COCMIDRAFT_36114 [Bipolaris oryzae ATCC 44560]|uniref:Uncharacterized protein n=1 Tax=Bipolaris oryzae ATCC 44560 TaxID=930090 RepID=W6Z3F4_COCMI|nr:uncharacterized protein COCMIDRAFT_36114 [Bipolaris oryzae ATCC 44560]EUC46282.1 hypothetical protein COCMIDRAFT_36114 [Bipolaris oryzae ATCC 44560]
MTGLSGANGKSRQMFNISKTYPQTTPPNYQEFSELQNYDEGQSIDSGLYQAATSIVGGDARYIRSFTTTKNFWPNQPAISGFPLVASGHSASPSKVGAILTSDPGASTFTSIANVDHGTHARIKPSHLLSGDDSAPANPGRVVPRDRTFGRPQDLVRHRNSVHELTKPLWCSIPNCNRSESFPRPKRPFSRKDKLTSHVRNMHYAAFDYSIMSVVQAGMGVGDSGNVGTEWVSGGSGVKTTNRSYGVGASSDLDDYTQSNDLADYVDPIGDCEPLDLPSVSTTGWFNDIDGVKGFDALTAADGIPEEQGISGEDMLFSSNVYVDTL